MAWKLVDLFPYRNLVGLVGPPEIIVPPSSYSVLLMQSEIRSSNECDYILPYVLLWDPLYQFHLHFKSGISCVNSHCSNSLSIKYWKYGQTNALQPRLVHGLSYTVLLVSVVYGCSNGHEVPSTDPRILTLISEEHMPFILLHRTGLTKNLLQTILQLFIQGMPLRRIETFIKERRFHQSSTKLACLKRELLLSNTAANTIIASDSSCHPLKLIQFPTPSNDILAKCFLAHFLQRKDDYERHMSSLTANTLISFDHTFKVASNIGFIRGDGRWITQYKSIFFVLNEVGQVLTWQLTSTTSLDEVKPVLECLGHPHKKVCSG